MGRLRVWHTLAGLGSISAFQFQYGAIKRIHNQKEGYEALIFQFQYGAIKRLRIIQDNKVDGISIPIWGD